MGTRKSSRRKGRRAAAQTGRSMARAADHRQLGQTRGRNRKTDRPAKTEAVKPQKGPDRPVSAASQPDEPELSPNDLADAVAAYARAGEFNIPTIAARLGVPVERVNAAVRAMSQKTS